MKRWLVRICVFLLLGAIVNVAVAWSIAVGDSAKPGRRWWQGRGASYVEYGEWEYVVFSSGWGPGRSRASCRWHGIDAIMDVSFPADIDPPPLESLAPEWARPTLPRVTDSRTAIHERIVDLRGWPCACLIAQCHSLRETSRGGLSKEYRELVGAIQLQDRTGVPRDSASPRMLPLRPIWPGFAINTVFYAAILWLLFAAPFVLRRWRRIRRGLCPKCAYDLRNRPTDSNACPECGAAVTRKATSP